PTPRCSAASVFPTTSSRQGLSFPPPALALPTGLEHGDGSRHEELGNRLESELRCGAERVCAGVAARSVRSGPRLLPCELFRAWLAPAESNRVGAVLGAMCGGSNDIRAAGWLLGKLASYGLYEPGGAPHLDVVAPARIVVLENEDAAVRPRRGPRGS